MFAMRVTWSDQGPGWLIPTVPTWNHYVFATFESPGLRLACGDALSHLGQHRVAEPLDFRKGSFDGFPLGPDGRAEGLSDAADDGVFESLTAHDKGCQAAGGILAPNTKRDTLGAAFAAEKTGLLVPFGHVFVGVPDGGFRNLPCAAGLRPESVDHGEARGDVLRARRPRSRDRGLWRPAGLGLDRATRGIPLPGQYAGFE